MWPIPAAVAPAAYCLSVNHDDPHPTPRTFVCTGRTDNTCAYDRDVICHIAHARMPMQNGSRGSSTSSASAFTNADPLMLG